MTQTKTRARKPRAWSEGEIQALARTPAPRHDCPTLPGLFMRVSPRLKAVWAYRFKHEGQEHSETLGEVLTDRQPAGMTFDQACTEFLAAVESVKNPRPRRPLAEAYQDWLAHHRNRRTSGALATRTRETYQRLFDHNLAQHGHVVLEETPPRYWRDVLQAIRDRAPHQARQVAMLLHSIHGHLVTLKEIPDNPIKPLIPLFAGRDLKKPRTGVIPLAALQPYFQAIKSLRQAYQDAPLTLTLTGWRMSAVLRMKWADLDLDAGVYSIPEGGEGWKGYTGTIALSASVINLLKERRARMKADRTLGEWVFPGRDIKRRNTHATDISEGIEKAGRAAGLDISPHDLRRTWSTAAHLAGLDALTISRLTGHKHTSSSNEDNSAANAWTTVGANYVIQQVRAESYASEQVASLLLELGGLRPISQTTVELLSRKGLEVPEGLEIGSNEGEA